MKRIGKRLSVAICLVFAGCQSTSILPVNANTAMISVDAAPACGQKGTQQVALREAAAYTLKSGYDSFVIARADYSNNVEIIPRQNIQVSATASIGSNNSGGPQLIDSLPQRNYDVIGGSPSQDMEIRMYRSGEPGHENALNARRILGPDWNPDDKQTRATCF